MAKFSGLISLAAVALCVVLAIHTVEGNVLKLKVKILSALFLKNTYHFLVAAGTCYEPMLETNCAKQEWRFFFDMNTRRCYGKMACAGGANNFKSWHECQNACARHMGVPTQIPTQIPNNNNKVKVH